MAATRRKFLKDSALAGAGLCAAQGLVACSLFDDPEMQVCTLAELQAAGFVIARFNRRQVMATFLDGEIVIFSLICRHKRCTVAWEPDEAQFQCPCHEGLYDKYGKVIDGPPPGPLYRFRHELREDALWVINEKRT